MKPLILILCALILAACTEQKPTTGVYLLLDTSGTYTKELKKAQQVIHYYLGSLNPGDSFAVARIDSGSFSEKDIIAKATFDLRPSRANEVGVARKIVLIYSDLKEELPKGYKRDFTLSLPDYEVIALNVTKLRSDNKDPKEYMDRMSAWRQKVEDGGGSWRIVNDLDREGALAF